MDRVKWGHIGHFFFKLNRNQKNYVFLKKFFSYIGNHFLHIYVKKILNTFGQAKKTDF